LTLAAPGFLLVRRVRFGLTNVLATSSNAF
jgi:hypothetical protein